MVTDFTRTPTRPGRVGPLDETFDETTGVGVVAEVLERLDSAANRIEDASLISRIRHDAKRAELENLPGSQWGHVVDGRLDALEARTTRRPARRLLITAIKAIGVGGIVTALLLAARALLAQGGAAAEAREQADKVRRHELEIRRLQQQQAADDEAHGRRDRE